MPPVVTDSELIFSYMIAQSTHNLPSSKVLLLFKLIHYTHTLTLYAMSVSNPQKYTLRRPYESSVSQQKFKRRMNSLITHPHICIQFFSFIISLVSILFKSSSFVALVPKSKITYELLLLLRF